MMKFLIPFLFLLPSVAHASGVVNGQAVNATVTNAAFLFKNGDDTDAFRITLNSGAGTSGPQLVDVQRNINSLSSFLGSAINGVYNLLPTWATNNVGLSTNTVFLRVEALDAEFDGTSGHSHDGTTGNGPILDFTLATTGQVANSRLGAMATHTYKGNNTGSTATPADITSTQLTADLNVFTSSLQGMVPASSGGTTNFLRADGAFATPPTGSGNAIGDVRMTAGSTCPSNTMAADGSSLLRTGGSGCGGGSCAALFGVIGVVYGAADGSHFTLPNLKGVFVQGAGSQTIGGISYTGTQGTTTGDTMQGHYHAVSDPGHNHTQNSHTHSVAIPIQGSGGSNALTQNTVGAGATQSVTSGATTATNNSSTTGITVTAATTDGSHGTPRVGSVTAPAAVSLLYCIQYQ